jgi:dTDP-glucose pyrophosphorylase
MLNIVIPMAGLGSRFSNAGFSEPKPLIKIHGEPMIRWVIRNLEPKCEHKFIFVALNEHIENYNLENLLGSWAPGSELIGIDHVTRGAAETVLASSVFIDNPNPLMIANSDQWIDTDINRFVSELVTSDTSGVIMTMQSTDPKWSFLQLDSQGFVAQVAEKKVISSIATVGIYGFKHGNQFVKYAHEMIKRDLLINGEFYVAPIYNLLIRDDLRINTLDVGSEADGMFGLGIPEDLERFVNHPISRGTWN